MRAHSASASRIWLLEKCAWWAQGSRGEHHSEGPSSPSAAHGTEVHDLVHRVLTGKPAPAESSPRAQHQAGLVLRWLKENAPAVLLSEVPLLYNVATDNTFQLSGEGHRAYGDVGPTEVPGTVDVMWLDAANQTAKVLDLKTGYHVEGADQSLQLETLGLAASRLYGVDEAMVGHVRVDDEHAWGEWHSLTAFD